MKQMKKTGENSSKTGALAFFQKTETKFWGLPLMNGGLKMSHHYNIIREDNETLPSLSNILYVASVSCKNEGEWFSNLIIGHVISLFRWIDCVPSQFMSKSNGNDILRKVQQAIILEKTVIIYAPLDFSIVINKYILGNGIFFSSGLESSIYYLYYLVVWYGIQVPVSH